MSNHNSRGIDYPDRWTGVLSEAEFDELADAMLIRAIRDAYRADRPHLPLAEQVIDSEGTD